MKTIKRIPRPWGSTLMNMKSNINKEGRQGIIDHILKLYCQSQYRINNTTYTFQEVAQYLGIEVGQVMSKVVSYNMQVMENLVDQDNQQNAYQSLIGMALIETLGDRQKLLKQIDLVSQSQGKAYKPFITAEYNNLLGTLIRSQGGLFEVAKLLKPGSGPKGLPTPTGPTQNINGNVIYTNGGAGAIGSEALTVDKATALINELNVRPDLDSLSSYVDGAPEVKALGQESSSSILLSRGVHSPEEIPEPYRSHGEYKANQAGMDDEALIVDSE